MNLKINKLIAVLNYTLLTNETFITFVMRILAISDQK
jgi:hypothetical protein